MIVYFSTVFRTAPIQQGGELVKLDWSTKRVLAKIPIVPGEPMITDPNPRGGTRGGRGILIDNSCVYVASYHTVHVFDWDLQPVRSISNPLFADIHEMAWNEAAGSDIWASSTVIDGAIKFDKYGNTLGSWWPREDPVVAQRYQLYPLDIDKKQDNRLSYLGRSHLEPAHTHLNTVAVHNGRTLVLLNKYGCIVQLDPTNILIEDPRLKGAHNILVTANQRIMVNDTHRHAILVFDETGRPEKEIKLKGFAPVKRIRRRFAVRELRLWLGERSPSFKVYWLLVGNITGSRPVFVRGLSETPRGTILVGISPATILEIDPESCELVDHFTYSSNVNEAVHGLCCCPPVETPKSVQVAPRQPELATAGASV
jgi:hypothetical protein